MQNDIKFWDANLALTTGTGHFTFRTQSISTKHVKKLSLLYYFYITTCVKIALHFLCKLKDICITHKLKRSSFHSLIITLSNELQAWFQVTWRTIKTYTRSQFFVKLHYIHTFSNFRFWEDTMHLVTTMPHHYVQCSDVIWPEMPSNTWCSSKYYFKIQFLSPRKHCVPIKGLCVWTTHWVHNDIACGTYVSCSNQMYSCIWHWITHTCWWSNKDHPQHYQ
jgi:hypothetical protein